MAEKKVAVVEDFLTCAVCLETFKEPVSLSCNHSFCYSCLQNYWKNNEKRCPVCRRKSSKENICVNFALKELSLSFSEEHTPASDTEHPEVCPHHPGVPPLFCKEELRLLCPVCEFSKHTQHTVVSVETAEAQLKEDLSSQLQSLKKHRAQVQRLEQTYKKLQTHSHKQVQQCEAHIRTVFHRLQHFLKEQEELSVSALKQEQHRQLQTIGPELESIREQLSSVDHSIQALEEQLLRTRETFLHTYSPPQSHQQGALSPPQLGKGLLINQAGVLGNLDFRVWEKMRDIVQYCPVVLDPNTAYPDFLLSGDLTSVGREETPLDLPDNPERFSKYPFVLGSEGFSSGTHSWCVEVGDHPLWILGVAKESIDRREGNLRPQHGFWDLGYLKNKYISAYETLTLKKRPQKVHVQLDYSRGTLSFYDSSDMSLIYTHRTTFTEKVFPFFCVGDIETDKDIKICPSQVSVK